MGLLITKRPKWRHVGIAGQLSPFMQQFRRRAGQDDKHVTRWRLLDGLETSLLALQIKRAPGMSEEDSPTFRADDPRDGHVRAEGGEIRTYLPVAHGVRRAPAIQGMTSRAKAKNRPFAKVEADRAGRCVKLELLASFSCGVRDRYLPRPLLLDQ